MLAAGVRVSPDLPPLGAEVEGAPWARRVSWALARLDCAWGSTPARILRGAVVQQIEVLCGASVSWHNHGDDAQTSARPAEVHYRVREGRAELFFIGPRAAANAALLGRVRALRLPAGEVIPVDGVDLEVGATDAQWLGKSWRRYRLVTPIFPSSVVDARRPRPADGAGLLYAWAGHYLVSSLVTWMSEVGIERQSISPHVVIEPGTLRAGEVNFTRPARGQGARAQGFMCDFITNAVLPSGAALGAHRSEGWGVVHAES
jgi:hypothetical protein